MELIQGDCLEVLKTLDGNSIDSLITDPPAGISFMGKGWDSDKGGRDQWIKWMSEVMNEALRVMKPGAHGLVWALPRTSHWTATALENSGFEIRDIVMHLFGTGFPKSYNISKGIDKKYGAEREVVGPKRDSDGRVRATENRANDINICTGRTMQKSITKPSGNLETKPSTDLAKQWDGWGTALKPALEAWILISKPFTTVPLDDIISQLNSNLREIVCQQLNAKYVKQISMSNPKDLKAGKSDFVQWVVVVLSTLEKKEPFGKMDMFKLQETAEILLNIALSWKSILTALLNLESKSITKMETDLITELKILNYSILQITQDTTTKGKTSQNGIMSLVTTVQLSLESSLVRLLGLMEISVPKNVFTKAENLKKPPKEKPYEDIGLSMDVLCSHYVLIRKPLSEKTVAKNVLKWGCGAINIDVSRIDHSGRRDPCGADGKVHRTTKNTYSKATSGETFDINQGRFPANLTLDDYAAKMLDEQSGPLNYATKPNKAIKNETSMFNMGGAANSDDSLYGKQNKGLGASRFFYCAKASKSERGKENNHPTVKALKLMKYLINMITPPNGIVLDPFMGSGSTGVACRDLGFKFLGIEEEEEYFEIAKKRVEAVNGP